MLLLNKEDDYARTLLYKKFLSIHFGKLIALEMFQLLEANSVEEFSKLLNGAGVSLDENQKV